MPYTPAYGTLLQSAFFSGTAASAQVAFTQPVLPGSLLVAAITWGAATGSVSSVIDQTNNIVSCPSFTSLMGGVTPAQVQWQSAPVFQADSTSSQFWYWPVNQRGGLNVVTITFSASQTYTIVLAEYFGGGQFIGSATNHGTSVGAALETQTVSLTNTNPLVAFLEWDKANAFQAASAQSQIQQPGVLIVGSFKTTAALGAANTGTTNRQTSGAVYAFGDTGPTPLSNSAAQALAVGWNVTGVATWDLILAAFNIPATLSHPI